MSEIFTSTAALALKETLEDIDTDEHGSEASKAVFSKWLTVKNMTDNYVDYVEYAGSGLAGEKPEGESYPVGTVYEGPQTRFNSRTYGQRMIVSEEAIEDLKYDKVVQAAKRNNRALWKLVDFDATLMLVRATNTSFVGGDGQPLASATHSMPGGGTYSNLMATPMSPSKAAVVIAAAQLMQQVGHDGLIDSLKPKKVVFPVQQWGVWKELLGSAYDPTPGAFNAINVVNKELEITPVPNQYWTNTTTNWAFITDADLGLMWLWRRKPKSNTWVTEDKTMMNYAISARWGRGWVNPRAILFSNA
jgi:hypothetical protein